MDKSQSLPDPDRLSVVSATILLAYVANRFIDLPGREVDLQLPGVYLNVELNEHTVIGFLVAGLTATGARWLLADHPLLKGKSTIQHWLLPTLTAWVVSIPLSRLSFDIQWVVGFLIGGGLLLLVLVAEYVVVDPRHDRHAMAMAGLTSVSFALFLILAIALRSAGVRLFLMLPAMAFAGGLVGLRTLNLRLGGRWAFWQSVVLALVTAQIIAALHYWPLLPITFGLAILGPSYALTSLISSLAEGLALRKAFIEPLIVLVVVWGIALWTI